MNLEIGHQFNKDGIIFCVLDIIDYDMKQYALFSAEYEKLDYIFYEVNRINNDYNLKRVDDESLIYELFKIVEERKNDE